MNYSKTIQNWTAASAFLFYITNYGALVGVLTALIILALIYCVTYIGEVK